MNTFDIERNKAAEQAEVVYIVTTATDPQSGRYVERVFRKRADAEAFEETLKGAWSNVEIDEYEVL